MPPHAGDGATIRPFVEGAIDTVEVTRPPSTSFAEAVRLEGDIRGVNALTKKLGPTIQVGTPSTEAP